MDELVSHCNLVTFPEWAKSPEGVSYLQYICRNIADGIEQDLKKLMEKKERIDE